MLSATSKTTQPPQFPGFSNASKILSFLNTRQNIEDWCFFFFFFNYLFRASQLWLKLNGNDLICDQSALTSLVNCGCLQHLLQYKQTFQICCNKASNNAFFSFLAGDIIFNARYPELPPDFIFGEDAEFLPEPSELPVSRMEECEMFNRGKGFFYIYNFPVSTVFITTSAPHHNMHLLNPPLIHFY